MDFKLSNENNIIQFGLPDAASYRKFEMKLEDALIDAKTSIVEMCQTPLFSKPLTDILGAYKGGKISIVLSPDIPHSVFKVMFEAFESIKNNFSIKDEEIQIILANGIRGKIEPKQIKALFGKEIRFRYDIINHDCNEIEDLDYICDDKSRNGVYINQKYLDSEIKILFSIVSPDILAGVSGPVQLLIPGLSGIETIQKIYSIHDLNNKAFDSIHFFQGKENEISQKSLELSKLSAIRPNFVINANLNKNLEIIRTNAGALQSYMDLVQNLESSSRILIDSSYDVAICVNSNLMNPASFLSVVNTLFVGKNVVKSHGILILLTDFDFHLVDPQFQTKIKNSLSLDDSLAAIATISIEAELDLLLFLFLKLLLNYQIIVVSDQKYPFFEGLGVKFVQTVEMALERCNSDVLQEAKIAIFPDGDKQIPYIQ